MQGKVAHISNVLCRSAREAGDYVKLATKGDGDRAYGEEFKVV